MILFLAKRFPAFLEVLLCSKWESKVSLARKRFRGQFLVFDCLLNLESFEMTEGIHKHIKLNIKFREMAVMVQTYFVLKINK